MPIWPTCRLHIFFHSSPIWGLTFYLQAFGSLGEQALTPVLALLSGAPRPVFFSLSLLDQFVNMIIPPYSRTVARSKSKVVLPPLESVPAKVTLPAAVAHVRSDATAEGVPNTASITRMLAAIRESFTV